MHVNHGCGLRNRNSFNKRLGYKRGEQCVLPTNKSYWRRTRDKCKLKRTQYSLFIFSKWTLLLQSQNKKIHAWGLWASMSCVRLCMTSVCIHKDNLNKANIACNVRKAFFILLYLSLILIVTLFFFYCITINFREKKIKYNTVFKNLFRWLHEWWISLTTLILNSLWEIFYLMKKLTLLNCVVTARTAKNVKDFTLLNLN